MLNVNISALLYLVAAIFFILSLKGLSSPVTARKGNTYGMVGMAIAVVTTLLIAHKPIFALMAGAIIIGGVIGGTLAKKVEMTSMPELVAAMHSLVGLSAVLIAVAAILNTNEHHTDVQKIELFIGCFIGAITFTASVIAYGKLSGKFGASALTFKGQHFLNLILFITMIGFGLAYWYTGSHAAFLMMTAVTAVVLGKLWMWVSGTILGVAMMYSRTYLGAHWLSDTVAGALLGVGLALLAWALVKDKCLPGNASPR